MNFVQAMTTNDIVTENGMPTHSTSNDALVDLFFKSGGARKLSESEIISLFKSALDENELLAIRCLFYIRDIRGGMGERRFFRVCLKFLAERRPNLCAAILHYVPEYGRWDDLESTLDTDVAMDALNMWLFDIVQDTEQHNTHSLAAKWFPRSGKWFGFARRTMRADAKSLRKALVDISTTVEQLMSAGEWDKIDYSRLPSKALHMYRKAFGRNDQQRYLKYQQAVAAGKAKMNAKTLFPSDVVKAVEADLYAKKEVLANENAWANLEDIGLNDQKILPVCDVSGSMSGEPMMVSVGLGLYLAERNTGPFKDAIITFDSYPQFHYLKGTLYNRVAQIMDAPWGTSTNLERTFRLILDTAVKHQLAPEEMPTKILIISDMQFNQAVANRRSNALEMIREQYRASGYEMPMIVFWNVRSSSGVPAKATEKGVNLVSGYSPQIMRGVLKGATNPLDLILDTLSQPRYSVISID